MANNNQPSRKRQRSKVVVGEGSNNWEPSRDTMVEGLKLVESKLLPHVADTPERAQEIYGKVETTMMEKRPHKSFQDLLDMLPRVTLDNVWMQEKEDRFQEAFAANPHRLFLESGNSFPSKSNFNYMKMWKAIPHVRNCFPSDIVGVKSHTKYDGEGGDVDIGNGVMKPDPRWSSGFCDRLTDLAFGSLCNANMGLLALLIRYVVADRIDDRRGMPLDNHRTGDRFFADLDARIKRENTTRSLRDLHADLRRDWEAAGDYVPLASNMMCSIEQHNNEVRSAEPTMPIPDKAFPMYAVQTNDLTRLVDACDDTVDELGFASLGTVALRAATVARARKVQKTPHNYQEINCLRIPLLEDEERFKAKRLLLLMSDEAGVGVNSLHTDIRPPPAPENDESEDRVMGGWGLMSARNAPGDSTQFQKMTIPICPTLPMWYTQNKYQNRIQSSIVLMLPNRFVLLFPRPLSN
ncbi:hypothetical protein F4678DRAFT_330018 [Xylaria arbuscula]|nr:hypothetical protein F4678DRAFT_330018 [Xylaria arbuscula]